MFIALNKAVHGCVIEAHINTEKCVIKTHEMRKIEMFKKILATSFAITSLSASLGVNAATFDFANIAEGLPHTATLVTYDGMPNGDYTGELGASSMYFTSGGIGVTASGSAAAGVDDNYPDGSPDNDQFAYLDSYSGGKPGGLGVCQDIDANLQCVPSSDDNVTQGESLTLLFDQEVFIDQIVFRNGDHGTSFAGVFDLDIDSGAAGSGEYALTNIFNPADTLKGTEFVFSNFNCKTCNPYQFYIETLEVSEVPIPAAVWLFGSGLIGLVGVARRRTS